jgi:hypothetical protein
MLLVLDALCLAGVLWCAVLVAGLLGGVRLVPGAVAVSVAAVLVLPGFTAGVVTNQRIVRGRQPQSGWVRTVWAPPVDLPRWARTLAGVVFLAFWLAGMCAVTGISPDPWFDGGVADQEARNEERFALGMLGGVGTGGTALAAASLLRGRRAARTPAG